MATAKHYQHVRKEKNVMFKTYDESGGVHCTFLPTSITNYFNF